MMIDDILVSIGCCLDERGAGGHGAVDRSSAAAASSPRSDASGAGGESSSSSPGALRRDPAPQPQEHRRTPPSAISNKDEDCSSVRTALTALSLSSRSFLMGNNGEEAVSVTIVEEGRPEYEVQKRASLAAAAGMEDARRTAAEEEAAGGASHGGRQSMGGPCSSSTLRTVAHLCVLTVIGESLRIFLGRLFGGECARETTRWLYSFVTALNLCVTSDGTSGMQGGALFIDLPANMVGSFLMGFLQPCSDLGLPGGAPMAFLAGDHWFQSWDVAHLALRAGFCSALTSFASWNTQMVVMMYGAGTGDGAGGGSQFFSAVFGYVLGLEAALASLVVGQTAAVWMHRRANSHRGEDQLFVVDHSRGRIRGPSTSSALNESLPEFEQAFLSSELSAEELERANTFFYTEDLDLWRRSTALHRRREEDGSAAVDQLLVLVRDIERRVIVDREVMGADLRHIAQWKGWDIDSLERWSGKHRDTDAFFHQSPIPGSTECSSRKIICASVPLAIFAAIIAAFGLLDRNDAAFGWYRTMWLAALFAPGGTLLRWKLSSLNGKLGGSWSWLPLGTLVSNLSGSVISVVAVAVSMRLTATDGGGGGGRSVNALSLQVLSAVKTGFAGSLSTVAAFVREGHSLNGEFPYRAKGYCYMLGTMISACLLGMMIFGITAYT